MMKKKFVLFFLLLISLPSWPQEDSQADQYPDSDPVPAESGEFAPPHRLPPSDYEEVPREEQEYVPEQQVTDDVPPEEVYEADEEYLE